MQVDDVVVFQGEEDQQKFFDWLDQNSDGYFVNVAPVYDAGMIHRATCPQFDRGLDVDWTNTAKACGLTQFVVDRWAEQKYGSYPERWTSTW